LESAVWYDTTLLSKKSQRAPVLMAKLIFSGMLPVALTNFSAHSIGGNHADDFAACGQQATARSRKQKDPDQQTCCKCPQA